MDIRVKLYQLQLEANEIQDKIISLCKSVIPVWKFGFIIGIHDCDISPLGKCVYDQNEDRELNECLYCTKPHQR